MNIEHEEIVRGDKSLGRSFPCFHCSRKLQWVKSHGLTYLKILVAGENRRIHLQCRGEFISEQLTEVEYDIDDSWQEIVEESGLPDGSAVYDR